MSGLARNAVWITWYSHRRTSSICALWNIKIITHDFRDSGLLRRPFQVIATVLSLWRHRNELVFVQNPSLGLAVIAVALRPLLRLTLVVDTHNEGVRPFVRSDRFTRHLTQWILGAADVAIVTNPYLAADVDACSGTPVVVPDALPDLQVRDFVSQGESTGPSAFVIATYAPDEPITEIIQAAKLCEGDIDFCFSGDMPDRVIESIGGLPKNVRRLGYLDENQFYSAMAASTVVVDLTKMDHCLVCGAFEAISVGVPLVLTDDPAGRDLFDSGIRFVTNTPEEIAVAVRDVCSRSEAYRSEIVAMAERYRQNWNVLADEAVEKINDVSVAHGRKA